MFPLYGTKFLITGASGGIGQALVDSFVNSGAELCISGTKISILNDIMNRYPNAKIHPIPCDLSNSDNVSTLVSIAIQKMSGLDGLIFNAGITKDKLVIRMTDEDWQSVIGVNLTSYFKISRDACKVMMKSGGRVICISSVIALLGNPGQCNYAASKGGMISYSRCLAAEFAKKNITVNCVLPGFIDTQMTAFLDEKHKEAVTQSIPMKRMGTPDEVAAVVRFLASRDASYITGASFNVSGGLLNY